MSTTTLTKAAATRLTQSLSPGLPPLPFPIDWSAFSVDPRESINLGMLPEPLTAEQQEANLLHVALWIVERGTKTFDMSSWHRRPDLMTSLWTRMVARTTQSTDLTHLLADVNPETFEKANHCNTTHCVAGFAQVMSGPTAFNFVPATVGRLTLGREAYNFFFKNNETALGYLRDVIARNS